MGTFMTHFAINKLAIRINDNYRMQHRLEMHKIYILYTKRIVKVNTAPMSQVLENEDMRK